MRVDDRARAASLNTEPLMDDPKVTSAVVGSGPEKTNRPHRSNGSCFQHVNLADLTGRTSRMRICWALTSNVELRVQHCLGPARCPEPCDGGQSVPQFGS